jgi:hypothetical protein
MIMINSELHGGSSTPRILAAYTDHEISISIAIQPNVVLQLLTWPE